jgi:hypothetical protein
VLVRVAAVLAALLVVGVAGAAWLLVQPSSSLFVVAGAAQVRVAEVAVGEREISYQMTRPEDGWQTLLVRELRHSGWVIKRGEPWGDTERFVPTYTRTAQVWFVRLHEEAQLLGSREYAVIKVTRRIRLDWRTAAASAPAP